MIRVCVYIYAICRDPDCEKAKDFCVRNPTTWDYNPFSILAILYLYEYVDEHILEALVR